MRLKKVLFWDFDGTLVQPHSKWSKPLYDIICRLGYAIELETVIEHLKTGFSWHTPEKDYVGSTGHHWWMNLYMYFDALYDKVSMSPSDRESTNESIRKFILCADNYMLYDDAIMALEACAELGFESYILSNNFPELESVISALGLLDYFEACISSSNIGYEKPRLELFNYALNLAGDPNVRFMIGDSSSADMSGGKNAGMTTILVHNDGPCDDADFICENLCDIPSIVGDESNITAAMR